MSIYTQIVQVIIMHSNDASRGNICFGEHYKTGAVHNLAVLGEKRNKLYVHLILFFK